jgi:hypothetical protein
MRTGRCTCGHIEYRLAAAPLVVHACHCTWCQRESGSAFALNGMIETRYIALTKGTPQARELPTASGKGQRVSACPTCGVALWASYHGTGPRFSYVKMGTLDETETVRPDVHIFTSTKQRWLALSGDVPVFEEFYRRSDVWRPEAYARFQAERAREG